MGRVAVRLFSVPHRLSESFYISKVTKTTTNNDYAYDVDVDDDDVNVFVYFVYGMVNFDQLAHGSAHYIAVELLQPLSSQYFFVLFSIFSKIEKKMREVHVLQSQLRRF